MNGAAVLWQALREPNFGRYVAGNSISLVGNWMQRTAIAWLTWELTGSVTWLGLIAFADLFPAIVTGPFGGVLADRVARRRIILIAQCAMLVLSLLMAILAWSGMMNRWTLLALTVVHGIIVGINQPARLAFVSSLIPTGLLPTAVAINSIVFNTARFIGPALAGILLATLGAGWTFFANCLTYIPLLVALSILNLPRSKRPAQANPSILAAIAEGLSFIWRDSLLRPLLTLFLACSLAVRPVSELLPAVADGRFGEGALGLAWMSSSLGIGAMLGGYTLATRPNLAGIQHYRFWLLACAGAVGLFILAWRFELAVLAIGICGFCFVVAGVGANTIIQLRTPDALRGRVLGLYGIIMRAAPALGALSLGLAADRFGMVWTICSSVLLFSLIFAAMEALRAQVRG